MRVDRIADHKLKTRRNLLVGDGDVPIVERHLLGGSVRLHLCAFRLEVARLRWVRHDGADANLCGLGGGRLNTCVSVVATLIRKLHALGAEEWLPTHGQRRDKVQALDEEIAVHHRFLSGVIPWVVLIIEDRVVLLHRGGSVRGWPCLHDPARVHILLSRRHALPQLRVLLEDHRADHVLNVARCIASLNAPIRPRHHRADRLSCILHCLIPHGRVRTVPTGNQRCVECRQRKVCRSTWEDVRHIGVAVNADQVERSINERHGAGSRLLPNVS